MTVNQVAAYITVRPEALAPGTAEWLRSRGFPPAFLVAKPDHVPFEQVRAMVRAWLLVC